MKFLLIFCLQVGVAFGNEATGHPGEAGSWSSARKVQVGTRYESPSRAPNSPLWFTLAEGILTEMYYPTIDRAQMRDSQILISDGRTFFHQEKELTHQVKILSPSMVQITNLDSDHHYQISHTFFTQADSPTLIDEVEIQVAQNGLHFYLLTNPQLNNTAAGDTAVVDGDGFTFFEGQTQLKVTNSLGFGKKSVGFVGFTDGYQDLVHDFQMNYNFDHATNGNVASTGELNIPANAGTYHFYVVYSFGNASKNLKAIAFDQEKAGYESGWSAYLNALKVPSNLSTSEKLLYQRSLYTLRCHEDKLNPGAFIASLSVPWGESQIEVPGKEVGGYHLIWPRDLFNVSVAMLNSGDYGSALRALRFLKKIQYKTGSGSWNLSPRIIPKGGAFPQNTWVTGRPYWEGFQIDQTAFPIHLFYHLYLATPIANRPTLLGEFQPMLVSALNFISQYGPWTHQERWEENFGISPSSFSAAASALYIGAKIWNNDPYGKNLQQIADHWMFTPNDNIDSWTFTTNGTYGNGHYYLRIAGGDSYGSSWNPNDHSSLKIANSTNRVPQDQVMDQGFLQLVLLGLKPATSPEVKASKIILDQELSVNTPRGRGWHRYSFDSYGENSQGRLWPLLGGEHARYFIERYTANDMNWNDTQNETNSIISSFLGFANAGFMIPEQVYEATGEGTGSATPLAWSHAEYIKLLWSVDRKTNIENVLR